MPSLHCRSAPSVPRTRFLGERDIERIEACVPDALRGAPELILTIDDASAPLAFMGAAEGQLCMLFAVRSARGRRAELRHRPCGRFIFPSLRFALPVLAEQDQPDANRQQHPRHTLNRIAQRKVA